MTVVPASLSNSAPAMVPVSVDGGPDAPLLSLAERVAPLQSQPRSPTALLQLDLKLLQVDTLSQASIEDATAAVSGLEQAIVVGSDCLDEARHLAAAMPGARVGCDPMRAASRDPGLARDSKRLFRHMQRRREGSASNLLPPFPSPPPSSPPSLSPPPAPSSRARFRARRRPACPSRSHSAASSVAVTRSARARRARAR